MEVSLECWQDREIRFDLPLELLKPRRGETEIDSINSVEDTKGNNGLKGHFSVTNLRLIWLCHDDPRTNLSIGWACVTSLSIRTANSRLRGNTQALYVTTRFQNNRFEFVFTSLIKQSPRLFTTAQAVHRAYDTSKLYRELKLRGAIIKDKQLLMLPEETVYSQVPGVWNLSSDQGNLGTFFVTNVRVVWFANMAENFNVSIPYLQMKDIKLRDSKFGPALVIETSQRSGGYILGFRVDPQSKLQTIFQEITRLYEVYSRTPVFGVQFQQEMAPPQSMAELKVDRPVDDVQVVDEGAFDALAVYFADQGRSRDREPVYSSELGLAVEKLPEGMTLDMLWKVST